MKERKVTIMLPEELIKQALKATGEGLTPTIRKGLEMIAAREAYKTLLKLKGKMFLGIDMKQLRKDRE